MVWLVAAEHLVIVIMGLAIGTVAGFAMSNIMVSAVAVTERGDPVLPPFVVTTNWALMGPIYVALIAVFAAALYLLARVASEGDLSKVTRVEGE
jgi:ABC-type antimicrobial peptide transport system permease subunit